MIERMKYMKDTLMNCVQSQLGDLSSVDAKELGEAVDMIKDFSEAIYYCTITESMEKSDKHKKEMEMEPRYYPPMTYYRDMDRGNGTMYYPTMSSSRGYQDGAMDSYPIELRDHKEGRSPLVRKTYMERKMHGGAKEAQMRELENYVQELTHDLTEMIEGASLEEKQMLQKKISALATKIV